MTSSSASRLLGAHHEARLDRELVHREAHRLAGDRLGHTRELEHHATGLHDSDPVLRVALAGTHARLGRLLRHRLVGEDGDPHLPTTLDVTGHRDSSSLDLAVRDPARLERLDPVVAEVHARATLGRAAASAALHLAVLDLLRHQHRASVLVAVELGGLVMLALAGTALDLLFLREESLELGVGLLDERRLLGHLFGGGVDRHLDGLLVTAAAATGAHDAALRRALAARLADGHRRLALDLVLRRTLVRQNLALVDPDLHADATERGASLG